MNPMESLILEIDRQIGRLRSAMTESVFISIERFFLLLAGLATPAAGAVGLAIVVVSAIKLDSLVVLLGGIGWLFALVLTYYMGSKARGLCLTTIRNNPSSVASQELIDVAAFTALTTCLALLGAGTYFSIKFSSLWLFSGTLAGSAYLVYVVWILLNPSLISTQVEGSASAGLDGISNIVMGYKIYLRLSTIIFGLLPTLGTVLLINSLFTAFGDPEEIVSGGLSGLAGFILVPSGLFAPWFIYVTFLFTYLFFDVMRSILLLGRGDPGSTGQINASAAGPDGPTTMPRSSAQEASEPSPLTVQVVGRFMAGLLALVMSVAAIIKGKELLGDYQERREAQRIEQAREKAEQERLALERAEIELRLAEEKRLEEERQAREKQRIADFTAKARKHVGGDSVDLLLEPEIQRAAREILKTEENMRAFEAYFAKSEAVVESAGLIIGEGCQREMCGSLRAILTIDLATAAVGAAVNARDRTLYFGYDENSAPAAVRKWAISIR